MGDPADFSQPFDGKFSYKDSPSYKRGRGAYAKALVEQLDNSIAATKESIGRAQGGSYSDGKGFTGKPENYTR